MLKNTFSHRAKFYRPFLTSQSHRIIEWLGSKDLYRLFSSSPLPWTEFNGIEYFFNLNLPHFINLKVKSNIFSQFVLYHFAFPITPWLSPPPPLFLIFFPKEMSEKRR